MSRRKQDRPQPRKTFNNGVRILHGDQIECGLCGLRFSLLELPEYLYHKLSEINKENLPPPAPSPPPPPPPNPLPTSSQRGDAHKEVATCTETTLYECVTCREEFPDSSSLSWHVKEEHGVHLSLEKMQTPKSSSFREDDSPSSLVISEVLPLREPSQEQQEDFYSQRLRQFADATSPVSATTPRTLLLPANNLPAANASLASLMSLSCQPTVTLPIPPPCPSVPHTALQASLKSSIATSNHPQSQTSLPSTASSSTPHVVSLPQTIHKPIPVAIKQESPSSPNPSPQRLKFCEFCGKAFKFKSNLVVHRRVHTGERPFKCDLCNHACTQASKLKRHMKTHKAAPSGNATFSPSGDEKRNSEKDSIGTDSANGEDDDDEEEDIEEEEEGRTGLEEMPSPEDLTIQTATNSSPALDSGVAEGGEKSDISLPDTPDEKADRLALLNEVMSKTGLADIPTYREAYNQILQENSISGNVKIEPTDKLEAREDDDSSSHCSFSTEYHYDEGSKPSFLKLSSKRSLSTALQEIADKKPRSELDESEKGLLSIDTASNSEHGANQLPWMPLPSSFQGVYLKLEENSNGALKESNRCQSPLSASPLHAPATNNAATKKDRSRNDTCEYCGKYFKNCSNLTVHRRSHTGEKPYKCDLCSYACAQSSKLTRHMKTHGLGSKDNFRCKFCNMPFSVPSTLEKHMRKCMMAHNSSVESTNRGVVAAS